MEKSEDTEQIQNNKKSGVFGLLSVFVGVLCALFLGWIVFPQLLHSKKPQPITFNHKLHVESVGLDCTTCHIAGPNGTFSGLPPLSTCAECHSSPQGESKEEAKLIKDYIEPNRAPFDGLEEARRLAYLDLDMAMRYTLEHTIAYVKERNLMLHPLSLEALEYFKNK